MVRRRTYLYLHLRNCLFDLFIFNTKVHPIQGSRATRGWRISIKVKLFTVKFSNWTLQPVDKTLLLDHWTKQDLINSYFIYIRICFYVSNGVRTKTRFVSLQQLINKQELDCFLSEFDDELLFTFFTRGQLSSNFLYIFTTFRRLCPPAFIR